MKYEVHIYAIVRVKVVDVEAESQHFALIGEVLNPTKARFLISIQVGKLSSTHASLALLFECMGKCCRNMLDTADIVRDACFRQLLFVRAGHKKGESVTRAFLSRSHPWERNQPSYRS